MFTVIIISGFGTAFAAFDYYLEIDGVEGESTDKSHERNIEIDSFSFGASNPTTVGSGGLSTGKVQFQDFHFTKTVDKSSPILFEKSAAGEHIKEATLTLSSADSSQHTYMVITFTDVLISSYSVSGNSGETPTESISLNFQKIQMEYFPQNPDGTSSESIKSREFTGHITLMK